MKVQSRQAKLIVMRGFWGTEEVYILDTKHNDRKMHVYVELFREIKFPELENARLFCFFMHSIAIKYYSIVPKRMSMLSFSHKLRVGK